MHAIEP